MKTYLVAIWLILTSSFYESSDHEYYVSVTELTYAEEKQSVQIISQVFIDDLEQLLRERYNPNIILATDNEPKNYEALIADYYQKKLEVVVNGKPVNFKYIGKVYDTDIIKSYLEIENVSGIKDISVSNTMLFEILPEQQHIIRLKIYEKNKSFLLTKAQEKCMLNFHKN